MYFNNVYHIYRILLLFRICYYGISQEIDVDVIIEPRTIEMISMLLYPQNIIKICQWYLHLILARWMNYYFLKVSYLVNSKSFCYWMLSQDTEKSRVVLLVSNITDTALISFCDFLCVFDKNIIDMVKTFEQSGERTSWFTFKKYMHYLFHSN